MRALHAPLHALDQLKTDHNVTNVKKPASYADLFAGTPERRFKVSASPNLSEHDDLVKCNTGLVVSRGGLKSIPRKIEASGSKGSKISPVLAPGTHPKQSSQKPKALRCKERRSRTPLFDDLRNCIGENVWRQWESRSRSQDAFAILCLLASYGLDGTIPHSLLVTETGLSRRQIARHLATLQVNGLLWRSPDYHRYAVRTELLVVAPRPIIGLSAAIECHRQRRRVRPGTPLSYSPSLLRLERHPNSISLAVAQSAKADYDRLRKRQSLRDRVHRWRFNHAALRDILMAVSIEYWDGWHNFSMRCFASPDCADHRKATLNLRADGPKAGVWRCFRCERRGYVDRLIAIKTGWDRQRVVALLRAHQAYEDPSDAGRKPRRLIAPVDLRECTGRRHPYCSDERHLTNETLDRYDVGYDHERSVVIIPVYDEQRTLVAYKERRIDSRRYNEVPVTDRRAFFGIDKVNPNSIVWVCEGEFDAMYVDQCLRYAFSHHAAIALSGKYLDERKLNALIKLQPLMFMDALDNDGAGHKASAAMRGRLERIAPVLRMDYEDFAVKDPNDSSPRQIIQQAYRANGLSLRLAR